MQNCSVLKPTHKVTNSDKMHFRKDVIERERSKKGGGKKELFEKMPKAIYVLQRPIHPLLLPTCLPVACLQLSNGTPFLNLC